MTDTVTEAPARATPAPDAADDSAPITVHRSRAWKRRRAAVRWFSVLTVLAIGGVGWLGYQGWDAAKKVKGGATAEVITDPSAPGFVAAVDPTPVHLVALTDADDALSALMAIVPNDTAGGTIVWSLGELVVDIDGEATALTGVYAEGGVTAVRAEFEKVLGFGASDVVVVGPAEIESLVSVVGALEISNPDPISVEKGGKKTVKFKAGELSLEPDEVDDFLTTRSAGEAPENRSTRTGVVMNALATKLATADSGTELGAILAVLGAGDIDFVTLPTERMSFKGSYLYSPDPVGIARELEGVVQFPLSSFAGQRPRVRVLNGTPDVTVARTVAPDLARVGGEVLLIGNADSLDAATSTVVYSDDSFKEVADRIAEVIGVSAERSEKLSDAADIDVVLGADYSR